jgi:hypothetical protein
VSKFLLNLLVEILKFLPESQKSLKFKNIYFSIEFPLGIHPSRLSFPALARLFRRPSFPSSARACLWRIPQNMFSSLVRAFHPRCPLSTLTDAWAPPISSLSHPVPTDPGSATTKSHLVRPPCDAQLCASSGRLCALTHPAIKAPP